MESRADFQQVENQKQSFPLRTMVQHVPSTPCSGECTLQKKENDEIIRGPLILSIVQGCSKKGISRVSTVTTNSNPVVSKFSTSFFRVSNFNL